jgi:hypothetical protein
MAKRRENALFSRKFIAVVSRETASALEQNLYQLLQ